ncbi:MAG: DUF2283 domain-containing protein [Candidatus Nanohaloarchaea archaeon]|nr:DUF2283 domain-containing protein [Candidatus Nanohaloarchaea archaeon]
MDEQMTADDTTYYDEKGDVLYITIEDAEGIAEHHGPHVLVRRHPDDGRVVGVTITDASTVLSGETETVAVQDAV